MSEICALMDIEPNDFDDPRRFAKVQQITGYFKDKPGATGEILRILSKDKREDKMDAVWLYVRTNSELEGLVSSLNPEHYPEDIAEEIQSGFLTKKSRDTVRKFIDKERTKAEGSPFMEPMLDKIEDTLQRIDSLSDERNIYG